MTVIRTPRSFVPNTANGNRDKSKNFVPNDVTVNYYNLTINIMYFIRYIIKVILLDRNNSFYAIDRG